MRDCHPGDDLRLLDLFCPEAVRGYMTFWRKVNLALNIVVLTGTAVLIGLIIWFLLGIRLTVDTTLRDAHVVILEAGLTLKNLREASQTWKDSSQEQATQTTLAMQSVS